MPPVPGIFWLVGNIKAESSKYKVAYFVTFLSSKSLSVCAYQDFKSDIFFYYISYLNMADQAEPKNEKISMEQLMKNTQYIDKFQTVLYIAGGIISGVLGLTGLQGLLLYLLVAVVVILALLLKMKFSVSRYTEATLVGITTNGLSSCAMSYVLFWTLAYALVHIY